MTEQGHIRNLNSRLSDVEASNTIWITDFNFYTDQTARLNRSRTHSYDIKTSDIWFLYNGNAEEVGNFRALNFYKASDMNIKEDIRLLIEDVTPRDVLMQIDGVAYRFKQGVASSVNKRFVGFIAQQVESVVPEAVQLIDGILHVDYESLIPYMNESIRSNFNDLKSIKAENETLKHTLDQIYNEFVTRDQQRRQYEQRETNANSHKLSMHPAWKALIALFALAVVVVISIAVISYARRTQPPTSEPVTPLVPSPPDDPTTKEYRILKELYDATDGPNWRSTAHWLNKSVSACKWHRITCVQDSIEDLVELDLSNNSLKGTIPSSLNGMRFWVMNLADNQLNGTIPSELFLSPMLQSLNITNNKISGTLPPTISTSRLQTFSAVGNRLTGTIPSFRVMNLDVRYNLLEGPLPQFDRNQTKYTTIVYVAHNNLTGDVGTITNLTNIMKLDISHNNLTGNLTFSTWQLRSLLHLDASYTSISRLVGEVPVPDLPVLCSCDLSHVPFKCPLPDWAFKCNAVCT